MRDYYKSIYNAAYDVYSFDNEEEAKDILKKLTKIQLLELNEVLDIVNLNKNDTKSQIIKDITFFGIRWDKDRRAIQTVSLK